MKQSCRAICLVVFLVSATCIFCIFGGLWIRSRESARVAQLEKLDDSRQYIIDIAAILGPDDWSSTSTGTFQDQTDLAGFTRSVVGLTTRTTVSLHRQDLLIIQSVMAYENEDDAAERFSHQLNAIRKNYADYSLEIMTLPASLKLNASRHVIICGDDIVIDEIRSTYCFAFFLYDRHVVYLNVQLRKSYTTYLTFDELLPIFRAIDTTMTQSTTP